MEYYYRPEELDFPRNNIKIKTHQIIGEPINGFTSLEPSIMTSVVKGLAERFIRSWGIERSDGLGGEGDICPIEIPLNQFDFDSNSNLVRALSFPKDEIERYRCKNCGMPMVRAWNQYRTEAYIAEALSRDGGILLVSDISLKNDTFPSIAWMLAYKANIDTLHNTTDTRKFYAKREEIPEILLGKEVYCIDTIGNIGIDDIRDQRLRRIITLSVFGIGERHLQKMKQDSPNTPIVMRTSIHAIGLQNMLAKYLDEKRVFAQLDCFDIKNSTKKKEEAPRFEIIKEIKKLLLNKAYKLYLRSPKKPEDVMRYDRLSSKIAYGQINVNDPDFVYLNSHIV